MTPFPSQALGLEPWRGADGSAWGGGQHVGFLPFSGRQEQKPPPPPQHTHTCQAGLHCLCELVMPVTTARMWESLLADLRTRDPANSFVVSSVYFLGRKSLFSLSKPGRQEGGRV